MQSIAASRCFVVADDDVLQLGEFLGCRVVLGGESIDVEGCVALVDEGVDVGKDDGVLVFEMFAHLADIRVVVLQYEQGALVVTSVSDGIDEFTAYGGEAEVEEIAVCLAQIVHQGGERKSFGLSNILVVAAVAYEVEHGKEGFRIDVVCSANFIDTLFLYAKGNIETAHHLQEAVVLADELCHFVG